MEIISTERNNLFPVYVAVALDLASVSISAPFLVYYIQTFEDDVKSIKFIALFYDEISYVSYTLQTFAIFSVITSK